VSRRASEARVGVEAAARWQTGEDRARLSLMPLLQLHRKVARGEDEQRVGFFPLEAAQQILDLVGGHLVDVLRRTNAQCLHGGGQLSRTKPIWAMNFLTRPGTMGWPSAGRDGMSIRVRGWLPRRIEATRSYPQPIRGVYLHLRRGDDG
jgi:hypothetical protein